MENNYDIKYFGCVYEYMNCCDRTEEEKMEIFESACNNEKISMIFFIKNYKKIPTYTIFKKLQINFEMIDKQTKTYILKKVREGLCEAISKRNGIRPGTYQEDDKYEKYLRKINKYIPMELIDALSDIEWDYHILAQRDDLSLEFMQKNIHLFNLNLLSSSGSITYDFFIKNIKLNWNYDELIRNKKISFENALEIIEYCKNNNKKISEENISGNPNVSENDILLNPRIEWSRKLLSGNKNLSENFLEQHYYDFSDKWDLTLLFENRSWKFIENHMSDIPLPTNTNVNSLSKLIYDYHWLVITKSNKISSRFIMENLFEKNWILSAVLEKHDVTIDIVDEIFEMSKDESKMDYGKSLNEKFILNKCPILRFEDFQLHKYYNHSIQPHLCSFLGEFNGKI